MINYLNAPEGIGEIYARVLRRTARKVTRSQLGLHLYECKAAATFNPEQIYAGV